jgi:hypothetical protein
LGKAPNRRAFSDSKKGSWWRNRLQAPSNSQKVSGRDPGNSRFWETRAGDSARTSLRGEAGIELRYRLRLSLGPIWEHRSSTAARAWQYFAMVAAPNSKPTSPSQCGPVGDAEWSSPVARKASTLKIVGTNPTFAISLAANQMQPNRKARNASIARAHKPPFLKNRSLAGPP